MQQDSYVLGCTLFQNGDPTGWASFDLETVMAGAQPGVVPITGWMKNYLSNPTNPPAAPTGLAATASTSVQLTWTNVAVNPTTFNVKRATNSGGPYTLIARNVVEGVSATTYADTTVANNGTTYYYVISGVNAAGEGPNSVEVSALPGLPRINCGGSASGSFLADSFFSGGLTGVTNGNIDLTGATNPAPMAVYQTQRYQSLTYNFPNLLPGSYKVRLHFAEIYWGAAGQRTFNVFINGAKVLNNFDIFVAAGGAGRANVQEFNAMPDASGTISIRLVTIVDNAAINGIELLTNPTNSVPAAPTSLTATVGSGNVTLNWSAPAGTTSFKVKRSTVNGGPYTVIASNVTSASFLDTSYSTGVTYYYVVSALNGAGESGNSSQVSAVPNSTLPDVVGLSLNWNNTSIKPGDSVFFKIGMKNQGTASIPVNSLGVGFLVDGSQVSYVGANNAVAIAPGASVTNTANGGPNSGAWIATAGVHTITAVIDDLNRFGEGNENNNLFSVPLTVYVPSYAINAGGTAVGSFAADSNYSGSANTASTATTIDFTGSGSLAPQSVYQSERWGNMTYTFPNLTPGKLYKTRLHFAEISPSVTQAGDRRFNVLVNGSLVLNDFDIFATAGAKFRARIKQFNTLADGLGNVVVQFTRGSANEPKASGLEIFPYTNTAPALTAISTKTINSGVTLVFTNSATDSDNPTDTLSFSLTNSPAGANVAAQTGIFSWTAPQVTTNQTNSATVVVTDNGSPMLSNSKTLSIIVIAPPKLSSVAVTNGNVNLLWSTFSGRTYQLQYKADLNAPSWIDLGAPTNAAGASISISDVAAVDQQRFYRIIQLD